MSLDSCTVETSARPASEPEEVGAVGALIARPQLATMLAPLAAGAVVGALVGVPFGGKLPERALKLTFAAVSAVAAVGLLVQLAA